jgi:hypothetical protein
MEVLLQVDLGNTIKLQQNHLIHHPPVLIIKNLKSNFKDFLAQDNIHWDMMRMKRSKKLKLKELEQ